MPVKTLFYFDNTWVGAVTQRDVGPLSPGPVNRVFQAKCRGEISFQSFTAVTPFTTENDIIWGLQWVSHGASPEDVLTSADDDHWFFRHALTLTTDVSRAWAATSTSGVIQGTDPLVDQYRGQSIKPADNIDLYVSLKAGFGIVSTQFTVLGAVEFAWD